MNSRLPLFFCLCLITGCATTTGVVPAGPGTYFLSEMRAPAAGGGPAAAQAVIAKANAFCGAQRRAFVPIWMRPDGDVATPYYPTAYDALFQCLATNDPAVARFHAEPAPPYLTGQASAQAPASP